MENEFEILALCEMRDGSLKTLSSGNPALKPKIKNIATFTDEFLLNTKRNNMLVVRVVSVNYLPHMFHRG